MSRYVIAVRRELWDQMTVGDALNRVQTIDGYRVVGRTTGKRTIVEATSQAAQQLRAALGSFCHVEREIEHIPQASGW